MGILKVDTKRFTNGSGLEYLRKRRVKNDIKVCLRNWEGVVAIQQDRETAKGTDLTTSEHCNEFS